MISIEEIKNRYTREIQLHEDDRDYWEEQLGEAIRRARVGEEEEPFIAQLARLFLDDSRKTSVNVGFVGEWRTIFVEIGFVGEWHGDVQPVEDERKEKVWQAYCLLMALQRNSCVSRLNIAGTVWSDTPLFNMLIQQILTTKLSWKYETIDFERFYFDTYFDDGMRRLPIEKPLKNLSFLHCRMESMQSFVRPEIMETLETLSLQSCVLYDTTGLAEFIGKAKNLKRLILKKLKLDIEMEQQLAYVLGQHKTLEHVEMDDVLKFESSLSRILTALQENNQLRRLIIKNVACSGETGQMLESFLVRNSSLVELQISASPRASKEDETQQVQPNSLPAETDMFEWKGNMNFSLQKLNLVLVSWKRAVSILTLVRGCPALYSLTASASDFPVVFNAIPNACFVLRYLYEINFSYCGLRKDDMHAIKSLLIISGCINKLTFAGDPIVGGMKVIADGITTNMSLKFLCLACIVLEDEDMQALRRIAELKPSLRIRTGLYDLTGMDESYRQEKSRRKMISDSIGFDQDHATLQEVLNFMNKNPSDEERDMVKRLTFMGPDAVKVTNTSRESVASTIVHASSGGRRQCSVM